MAWKFKNKLEHKSIIDITSLVDLIFLLVAFFMVTSTMGMESSIFVNLPKADTSSQFKSSDIVISVNNKNEIFIDDKKVADAELLNTFKQIKNKMTPKSSVVIRGDKKASYETIINIIDFLKQVNISQFSLLTVK